MIVIVINDDNDKDTAHFEIGKFKISVEQLVKSHAREVVLNIFGRREKFLQVETSFYGFSLWRRFVACFVKILLKRRFLSTLKRQIIARVLESMSMRVLIYIIIRQC